MIGSCRAWRKPRAPLPGFLGLALLAAGGLALPARAAELQPGFTGVLPPGTRLVLINRYGDIQLDRTSAGIVDVRTGRPGPTPTGQNPALRQVVERDGRTVRVCLVPDTDYRLPACSEEMSSFRTPAPKARDDARADLVAWIPDGVPVKAIDPTGKVTVRDVKTAVEVLRFEPDALPPGSVPEPRTATDWKKPPPVSMSGEVGMSFGTGGGYAMPRFPGRENDPRDLVRAPEPLRLPDRAKR